MAQPAAANVLALPTPVPRALPHGQRGKHYVRLLVPVHAPVTPIAQVLEAVVTARQAPAANVINASKFVQPD